ncbi:hypothetical protein [Pedobacter jeongneungensis]|uniref:hypothetical protein n=1 Tax=Pedobacter jeongneungensis TaxID=947309 RepID=UPI0004681E38|nr:hypothetical protein [Pedobacter jeongneungensis]
MKNFNQHIKEMSQHLNLSEEAVLNLFLDLADEFLMDYAGNANAAKIWKATPEFWLWWQQMWQNRDKMILKRYPQRLTGKNTLSLYSVWQSPKYNVIKPTQVVCEAFMRTIKQKKILLKQLI